MEFLADDHEPNALFREADRVRRLQEREFLLDGGINFNTVNGEKVEVLLRILFERPMMEVSVATLVKTAGFDAQEILSFCRQLAVVGFLQEFPPQSCTFRLSRDQRTLPRLRILAERQGWRVPSAEDFDPAIATAKLQSAVKTEVQELKMQ